NEGTPHVPSLPDPALDPLLRRSVCAAGQPACPQVSRYLGLSGSNRKFPALTGRSGTQRARACFGEHLIRGSWRTVQDCPPASVYWADIPSGPSASECGYRLGSTARSSTTCCLRNVSGLRATCIVQVGVLP